MKIGDVVIPDRESDAPEILAAWYHGANSMFDAYRTVVLSACREVERLKAAAAGEKVTDGRANDLAHGSDIYTGFLASHLEGRQKYEKMWLETRGASYP